MEVIWVTVGPNRGTGRYRKWSVGAPRARKIPLPREVPCDTRSITSIHIAPDDGEKIPRGPRYHRVLAELPELEVIDARFGPGFSVATHAHHDHVDSFYVLEGEAEFILDGNLVRADAGSWVAVPVGVRHSFRNAGDGELRILNIHAPGAGFADRLRANS